MTVSINRRSFLGGFLAVTAVSASGISAFASDIPVLWGDCVHDDTDALNALFSGKPVRVEGEAIVAKDAHLSGGKFLISDTIYIRNGGEIHNVSLHSTPNFRGLEMINIAGCRDVRVDTVSFHLGAGTWGQLPSGEYRAIIRG